MKCNEIGFENTGDSLFFNIKAGDFKIHIEHIDGDGDKLFFHIYKNKKSIMSGHGKLKDVLKEIEGLLK